MLKYFIFALILFACVMRFVGLEVSPPSFYIDEAMGAAHSLCYQQTSRDVFGRIGIFSQSDFYGFQSAPFLISGAVWTSVFGTGAFGFRSFTAFLGVLTIFAIYRLAQRLSGDKIFAIWAALFAACLPWGFQFSRISWDAPMGTALMMVSFAVLFQRGLQTRKELKSADWACVVSSGILFGLASYCYSPMRIQAALMVSLMPGLSWRPRAALLSTFAAMNVPVLSYYSDPVFTARSKLLAITSDYPDNPFRGDGIVGLAFGFVKQVLAHFNPDFLVLHGDHNLRHSIQTFGMLDYVAFAGAILGLVAIGRALVRERKFSPRDRVVVGFAMVGIFGGITPAALTWESVPHAIRSLGAWPFFAIFAAYGWCACFELFPKIRLAVLALSAILFAVYMNSFFFNYPRISGAWFDVEILEQMRQTRQLPENYGPVSKAYHRMTFLGESCEEVRKAQAK